MPLSRWIRNEKNLEHWLNRFSWLLRGSKGEFVKKKRDTLNVIIMNNFMPGFILNFKTVAMPWNNMKMRRSRSSVSTLCLCSTTSLQMSLDLLQLCVFLLGINLA